MHVQQAMRSAEAPWCHAAGGGASPSVAHLAAGVWALEQVHWKKRCIEFRLHCVLKGYELHDEARPRLVMLSLRYFFAISSVLAQ